MRKMSIFLTLIWFACGLAVAHAQPSEPLAPPAGSIVYVGAEGNVWLLDPATGSYRPLTADASETLHYWNPDFAPDGRYLAYCRTLSLDDEPYRITIIQVVDWKNARTVASVVDAGCDFTWSADSQQILYTPEKYIGMPNPVDHSQMGIWQYNLNAGTAEQIILPGERALAEPAVSPLGTWISFYGFCFECVGQFTTIDLNSGQRYEWSIPDSEHYVGTAMSWSPDGRQVVFDQVVYPYISPAQTTGLLIAQADGSQWRTIYSEEGQAAAFPLWSPRGDWIAFSAFTGYETDNAWEQRSDLMLVAPDGSNSWMAYHWTEALFPQAWSPDGRWLLFTLSEPEPENYAYTERFSQLNLLDTYTGAVSTVARLKVAGVDWGILPIAATLVPPTTTSTSTSVPPTATATPLPPTSTPVTPTATHTPTATYTATATPPTPSPTPIPPTPTRTITVMTGATGGLPPDRGEDPPGLVVVLALVLGMEIILAGALFFYILRRPRYFSD